MTLRKVLNVGGGSKAIPIPAIYGDWEHLLLDINPAGNPDLCRDARDLTSLPAGQFDAVYCSHNLEHYYLHDIGTVLRGFAHVLRADGFADIRVPDVAAVMSQVVAADLDIGDVLYTGPSGPITVHDVLYGYSKELEGGNPFYAHKTGFTENTLTRALQASHFAHVFISKHDFQLDALAFLQPPGAWQRQLFGL
jgi:predicted SAM-dependent methyltransferase